MKSEVFGWRGREGSTEEATKQDPNRNERMKRWPALAGGGSGLRSLGALKPSHGNRTARKKHLKIERQERPRNIQKFQEGIRLHPKSRYQKDGGARRVRPALRGKKSLRNDGDDPQRSKVDSL